MPKNSKLAALRSLRALECWRYGSSARVLHLAYGLLCGRPLARIESPNSNPHTFPSTPPILKWVESYYRPIAEGQTPAEYEAEKAAFFQKVEADINAWTRQLHMNWVMLEAKRRAHNTAKRAAGPRVHTARPATLAARGA